MKKNSSKNMFKESYIIAHRGIHNNKTIYENTLESFKPAIKQKLIIELDIRLTKDKQIIVFHDNNTKRITKQNKIVEENTYQELNNQDIIHIPLLSEVLKLVDGKVPLLIEIKPSNQAGELETILMKILKTYKGQYAIQSFSPKVLYWFKRNYPNILRGQLSSFLEDEHIKKISTSFRNYCATENFSYVAPIEEIRENDYWLGIPQYVAKGVNENPESAMDDAVSEWYISSNETRRSCEELIGLINFGG